MTKTTLWLEQEKAPDLCEALKLLLGGSTEYSPPEPPGEDRPDENPDVIGLIPWFSLRDGAFASDLCVLWKQGCRRFVLVTPSSEHPLPWARFPAHLRTAFDVAIQVCNTPSSEQLQKALGAAKSVESWANHRVQEYVEARTLYTDLLSIFSHNSQSDLSNQFLAPARLLCLANDKKIRCEWNTVWNGGPNGFQQIVLNNLPGKYGFLGKELTRAAAPITEGLTEPGSLSEADLESLMALLTGIRVSAGVRTHAGNSFGSKSDERVEPVCAKGAGAAFRVLVVDDHAASWRPVFGKLRDKLAAGVPTLDVCFEFSVDGKIAHQCAGKTQEPIHFSYYDLVILDVFLGGTTGIKILNLLRRDFSQLPVLLWTTSRDEEITAEATLANGVLLKKTVTWESLAKAVARWVERGKAMRTKSLPNPFFNHTIRNLKYRELAVDFHEWCLKQLDSFHALDSEYFRFFTDHGGRHIVKLWELLEQALQPFLQDAGKTLLPNDEKQRELEILGLYLTVICHELGMFPMRIGDKVENFADSSVVSSKEKTDFPDDVRTLHAARGMLMVCAGTRKGPRYWNDERGAELGEKLSIGNGAADSLGDRVAVLIGYHARLFKSLAAGHFLKWDKAGSGFAAKVAGLHLKDHWHDVLAAIEKAFTNLDACLHDGETRERLRLQCAVFRFVDALDVTHTRNPAEFLAESGNLPAKQHGENLKRELCESATINSGEVSVKMLAPRPDVGDLAKIIHCVHSSDWGKDVKCDDAITFCKAADAEEQIQRPWNLPNHSDLSKSVLCFQKPLDCWLKQFWRIVIGGAAEGTPSDKEFIDCLAKIGVLQLDAGKLTLAQKGARVVASITSLSVAGEIIDEYEAIIEAGLTEKLRLGEFRWDEDYNWDESVPKSLTTLRKAMSKHG